MAIRADNKCGSCYTTLRKGKISFTDTKTVQIVLCDSCWDIWGRGDDSIMPPIPITEGLNYGTI